MTCITEGEGECPHEPVVSNKGGVHRAGMEILFKEKMRVKHTRPEIQMISVSNIGGKKRLNGVSPSLEKMRFG